MADRKRLIFANIFVKTTRAVSKRVIFAKNFEKIVFLTAEKYSKI